MKKIFFGIIIGIFISGVTVYAASILAGDITYTTSKNSSVKTVEEALNDLYNKQSVATIDIDVNQKYQLPKLCEACIYRSSDENIATVDENGLILGISLGNTTISIINNDKEILKYNATVNVIGKAIEITSGVSNSYSSYNDNTSWAELTRLANIYLFDGIKTKQGSYGALLMTPNRSKNVYFTVNGAYNISFTSNIYSDGGGSSGKTVTFYKINSDGTETLYYTLVQKNNTIDYGTKKFVSGNYVMRVTENYVEFDEWTITPV